MFLEPLENRVLLSCDLSLSPEGVLEILGNDAAQAVHVEARGTTVAVQCSEADGSRAHTELFHGVNAINADLGGGGDRLSFHIEGVLDEIGRASVVQSFVADGGGGDDTMQGVLDLDALRDVEVEINIELHGGADDDDLAMEVHSTTPSSTPFYPKVNVDLGWRHGQDTTRFNTSTPTGWLTATVQADPVAAQTTDGHQIWDLVDGSTGEINGQIKGASAAEFVNIESSRNGVGRRGLYVNVHTEGGDDQVDVDLVAGTGMEALNLHLDGGDGRGDFADVLVVPGASSGTDVAIEELQLVVEGFDFGRGEVEGFASADVLVVNNGVSFDLVGRGKNSLGTVSADSSTALQRPALSELRWTISTRDPSAAEYGFSLTGYDTAAVRGTYFDGRLLTAADMKLEAVDVTNLDLTIGVQERGLSRRVVGFSKTADGADFAASSSLFEFNLQDGMPAYDLVDEQIETRQANRRYLYFAKVADVESSMGMNIRPLGDRVLVRRVESRGDMGEIFAGIEGIDGAGETEVDISRTNVASDGLATVQFSGRTTDGSTRSDAAVEPVGLEFPNVSFYLSAEAVGIDAAGFDDAGFDVVAKGEPILIETQVVLPVFREEVMRAAQVNTTATSDKILLGGLSNWWTPLDTDDDGTPDFLDYDSDSDGLAEVEVSAYFDGRFLTATDLTAELDNVGKGEVAVELLGVNGQYARAEARSDGSRIGRLTPLTYNVQTNSEILTAWDVAGFDEVYGVMGDRDGERLALDASQESGPVVAPGVVTLRVEQDGEDDQIDLGVNDFRFMRSRARTNLGDDQINIAARSDGGMEALSLEIDSGEGDDVVNIDLFDDADALAVDLDVDTGVGRDSLGVMLNITPRVSADVDAAIDLGDGDDTLVAELSAGLSESLGLSFVVLGGAGDDTAEVKVVVPPGPNLLPDPIVFIDMLLDMGDGDDEAELELELLVNYATLQMDANVQMLGGAGRDKLNASVEFDGPARGSFALAMFGGDGDDMLRLRHRRLPSLLDTLLLIDGGDGFDRCFAEHGTTVDNCEQ